MRSSLRSITGESSILPNFRRGIVSEFAFRLSVVILVVIVIGCESQTFQYSRGWTNGKRGQRIFLQQAEAQKIPNDVETLNNDGMNDETLIPSSAMLHQINLKGQNFLGKKRMMLAMRGGNVHQFEKQPIWILRTDSTSSYDSINPGGLNTSEF